MGGESLAEVEVRSEGLGLGFGFGLVRWWGGMGSGGRTMEEPRRTRSLILGQPLIFFWCTEAGFITCCLFGRIGFERRACVWVFVPIRKCCPLIYARLQVSVEWECRFPVELRESLNRHSSPNSVNWAEPNLEGWVWIRVESMGWVQARHVWVWKLCDTSTIFEWFILVSYHSVHVSKTRTMSLCSPHVSIPYKKWMRTLYDIYIIFHYPLVEKWKLICALDIQAHLFVNIDKILSL